ncbi:MAG: DNA-binding protein WhiA [Oscillospiraceae bacterium]|nr:DNA-binding protein WhiA [Oscillospiraceae bacterium]
MASFANEVKREIASAVTDKDKRYACLYGVILFCRNINGNCISFTTESMEFSALFRRITQSVFKKSVTVSEDITEKKNGGNIYSLSADNAEMILQKYNIDMSRREINLRHVVTNSLSSFLAGIFLICGSISDPNREYHLEFTLPDENLFEALHSVLLSIGIDGRKTERKGQTVLYIKDSENIEDFLTFIGAQQSTIDIMNIKIYKDVRNKANRIANCDSANIDKVIAAASKQTEDIEFLIRCNLFETLSAELRETAELRLENPEMTLQEIGEMLSKPIGRSGVMRRFKIISQIADELRTELKGG